MSEGLYVLYCDDESFAKIKEDKDLCLTRRYKGFDMFFCSFAEDKLGGDDNA